MYYLYALAKCRTETNGKLEFSTYTNSTKRSRATDTSYETPIIYDDVSRATCISIKKKKIRSLELKKN